MAALDVAVLPALRQMLRRVLADRTAIVVTHDPLDALLLADRVVVLEAGRVVEQGPSREVLSRPRSAVRGPAGRAQPGRAAPGATAPCESDDGSRVHGLVEGTGAGRRRRRHRGVPARRRWRSTATRSHGSPRNAFAVTVTEVEPRADLVRVHAGELAADVTVQAAADLELAPGSRVTFIVKATEVAVYAPLTTQIRSQGEIARVEDPVRPLTNPVAATSSTARIVRSTLRQVSLARSSADQPRSASASSRFG